MSRKIAKCAKCAEEKEIVGGGLCVVCYRGRERRRDAERKSANGIGPREIQIISNYAKMFGLLGKLELNRNEIAQVKKIVDPHVVSVAHLLNVEEEEEE